MEYNEFGLFTKNFPDQKLSLFSRVFATGEVFRVPSSVRVEGPCTTAPLLVQGSISLINEQDEMFSKVIHGGPGKIFPHTIIPGIFRFETLEDDTTYTCLTQNDPALSPLANAFKYDWDFSIETQHLSDLGTAFTVAEGGKTSIVICMHGIVTVESSGNAPIELNAGDHFLLEEGQIVTISLSSNSPTFAEVAWPEGIES